MRPTILTLTLIAAPALSAAVPTAGAQPIDIGVRAGVVQATAATEGSFFASDVGTRSGMHAGLVGKVHISSWFALQTEVTYAQKGFSEGDGDVSLSVDYIEIPVFAVLELSGKISPHLMIGPVLSLESSCTVASDASGEVSCDEATDLPRTKGADSGLAFGAGAGFEIGPGTLYADALYNYGLTNVAEGSETIESIKTRTFYISVGYLFPFGASTD
jgi:hypothetical protein